VSVEAAAPLVETRNPAVGATITSEQIDAMPLEGRSAVVVDYAHRRPRPTRAPAAAAA